MHAQRGRVRTGGEHGHILPEGRIHSEVSGAGLEEGGGEGLDQHARIILIVRESWIDSDVSGRGLRGWAREWADLGQHERPNGG